MLSLTSLFWAGNVVAGRLAVGEVSPMAITCLRWVIAAALLLTLRGGALARDWPLIAPRWRMLVWMGVFGYTGFNALFYVAARHTLGVNLAIIQGSLPIFVLALGMAFTGLRIGARQALGVALTVAGVVAVAARGDLAALATLGFNVGDLGAMLACFIYAIYTLALPGRPKVDALSFLAALALAACLSSIPLFAAEALAGAAQWPTAKGWVIVAYIAVFPSLLAQVCLAQASQGRQLVLVLRCRVSRRTLCPACFPLCCRPLHQAWHLLSLHRQLASCHRENQSRTSRYPSIENRGQSIVWQTSPRRRLDKLSADRR